MTTKLHWTPADRDRWDDAKAHLRREGAVVEARLTGLQDGHYAFLIGNADAIPRGTLISTEGRPSPALAELTITTPAVKA